MDGRHIHREAIRIVEPSTRSLVGIIYECSHSSMAFASHRPRAIDRGLRVLASISETCSPDLVVPSLSIFLLNVVPKTHHLCKGQERRPYYVFPDQEPQFVKLLYFMDPSLPSLFFINTFP